MKLNAIEIPNIEITEEDVVYQDEQDVNDPMFLNLHSEEATAYIQRVSRAAIASCNEIDQIVTNYNKGYITSLESFSGLVNSPLVGLANIAGHVMKLFSTALFSGWKDFKRSELKEYYDSNMVSTSMILNKGIYQDYQTMMIPTPVGMKDTYPNAVSAISDYLNEVSMVKKAKSIQKTLETIRKDCLSPGSPNFTSHVNDLHRTIISKASEQKFEKLSKIFSADKNEGGDFKTHFYDISSLKKTIDDVIKMDAHLTAVAGVYSTLERIVELVESITELTKDLKVTQVNDLSKSVRATAVLFEQYAITLNDLNRINHNLTLLLVQMRKS